MTDPTQNDQGGGVAVAEKKPARVRRVGAMPRDGKTLKHAMKAKAGGEDVDLGDPHTLVDIPVDSIDMPVLTREINKAHVDQLAENIAAHGLQTPITVYHNGNNKKPRFILGPGSHRLAAHKKLGLKTIRAFVRPPASMGEIRLAQAIENVQRKDLNPIEEAMSCQVILDAELGNANPNHRQADSYEAAVGVVAEKIGVTKIWLHGRLSLLRLSPRVQQMLLDGDMYLAHAQVLSRVASHETQEEIAGHLAGSKPDNSDKYTRGRDLAPQAVWRWRDMVERELRSLKDVPWKLDVEFAGKPACSECPNNSGNAGGLFDGHAPKKPQCLKADCYREKSKQAANALRRATNTVVKLTVEGSSKITLQDAEAAASQREATFIEPKVIVAAAKKQAAPKATTAAEDAGRAKQKRDQEITQRYDAAFREWSDQVNDLITKELQNKPLISASIALLSFHKSWAPCTWRRPGDKLNRAEEADLGALTKLLNNIGTPAGVMDIADALMSKGNSDYPGGYDGVPDLFLPVLAKVLLSKFPPAPVLADFKTAKPADAASASPAKKKRGKS